jgi:hypothetical protein
LDDYVWKLLDFNAESRKEKLMRKLLISREVQKNLLCFANCKKPIKKARKNFNRRESFSSFLIIGDTRKY